MGTNFKSEYISVATEQGRAPWK